MGVAPRGLTAEDLDVAVVTEVKSKEISPPPYTVSVSVPDKPCPQCLVVCKGNAKFCSDCGCLMDEPVSVGERVKKELLPGGKFPPQIQYWIDFKSTDSTAGQTNKAAALAALPWLYKAIKQCHHDRSVKENLRDFLGTERFVCNLLFLGVWNAIHDETHLHLELLGGKLLTLYNTEDLGTVFSDAKVHEYIQPNPSFAHFGNQQKLSQAAVIPGLQDTMHFSFHTPETMDENVALHVLILVTQACDEAFQKKVTKIASKYASFGKAPPKSFSRCLGKMSSPDDYRFEAKPRCVYNIDVSRNLASAQNPSQVFDLLKEINDEFGGYAKLKNLFTLPLEERAASQSLLLSMRVLD